MTVPRLGNFLELMEYLAPARLAEQWDNSGLQIGNLDQKIEKIFSSLDPTQNALMGASKAGAQLLFTHHPLIFKSVSHIEFSQYPGCTLMEAAQRHISVFAAHTNLDKAKGGINDILSDLMQLENPEVLLPHENETDVGLGRVGDMHNPRELFLLANDVRKILRTNDIRIVGRNNKMIKRVAIIGGSGGSLISLAAKKGADLLLTGDVGHHAALEAESLGMGIIDGGHFETEKTSFNLFCENLKKIFKKKGWVTLIENDISQTNPIRPVSVRDEPVENTGF